MAAATAERSSPAPQATGPRAMHRLTDLSISVTASPDGGGVGNRAGTSRWEFSHSRGPLSRHRCGGGRGSTYGKGGCGQGRGCARRCYVAEKGIEGARGGVGGGDRRPLSRCQCPNPSLSLCVSSYEKKTWGRQAHTGRSHPCHSLGKPAKSRWEPIPSEADAEATAALAPFGWNYKPAEKHCWLIFCERKIMFWLKKQAE
jgi:hypothetical protein